LTAYPPPDFDYAAVRRILIASEAHKTRWRDGGGAGHGYERHVSITNAGLHKRVGEVKNGETALRTAFISPNQQIEAACETLNGARGKWARGQFFQGARSDKFPNGSHNGMEATILHSGTTRSVRYAGGAGMIPLSEYLMVLLRDDDLPESLFVKTFYATILEGAPPLHAVTVFGRNRKLFAQGP
jgi:hypothetical protein